MNTDIKMKKSHDGLRVDIDADVLETLLHVLTKSGAEPALVRLCRRHARRVLSQIRSSPIHAPRHPYDRAMVAIIAKEKRAEL